MPGPFKNKVQALLQSLHRRYGRVTVPEFLPPPSSADAQAAVAVATKNSEVVAAAVLGLHGPPQEGYEAARRMMTNFVDWNEIRVSNAQSLIRVLGRDPRAAGRVSILQRFLEAFFLKQRNLNLEHLVPLKPHERKQFLSDLEVFSREDLAAILLSCFGQPNFPPAEAVHRVAQRCGLIRAKTTTLQMAKMAEDGLEAPEMLELYAHLYAVANEVCHEEKPKCSDCTLKLRCPAAKAFLRAAKK